MFFLMWDILCCGFIYIYICVCVCVYMYNVCMFGDGGLFIYF